MRAVLMSMKPEWWEKILSGEKTLEIRKSAPQSKDGRAFRWPLTVLVYVSGTGAVQGKFTCWGGSEPTCWKCWWSGPAFPWRPCGPTQKAGAFTGG